MSSVIICFFFFRYVWLSSTACTARDTSQGCRWAVYTFYINTSVWNFFWSLCLNVLGRCKDYIERCRMMLLLMRRFPDVIPKNGVFVWSIIFTSLSCLIIVLTSDQEIFSMSQVRWKLFQSKFSNKIIRLHFFLSLIVTQLVCTEVFFMQMMVARLMLLLH